MVANAAARSGDGWRNLRRRVSACGMGSLDQLPPLVHTQGCCIISSTVRRWAGSGRRSALMRSLALGEMVDLINSEGEW